MNMTEVEKQREQMSDLMDGRLEGDDFAAAVALAHADPDARACWHAYHLIGDVLRSSDLAGHGREEAFVARLRTTLAQEPARPVVLIAPESEASNDLPTLGNAQNDLKNSFPANEPVFRWKALASVASVVAVAALGWSWISGLPGEAQLARVAPTPATAVPQAPVMIRDARLDELLAAHRQSGGASALQMPSGFLRNATFEGPAR
jgi:sigma-E factor negative regulatory protein RseA